jgi:hypothetical protein
MPPRVKFQVISTECLMRITAERALGYLYLALTVMVALGGTPCTYSILPARECFMTEPLTVIALFWSSDLLEYTHICRFTCNGKVVFLYI